MSSFRDWNVARWAKRMGMERQMKVIQNVVCSLPQKSLIGQEWRGHGQPVRGLFHLRPDQLRGQPRRQCLSG